ncbi:digeranylgeranylglyceryl phosphate synthase [Candidatus Methanoplasma termitum]|uniref:Digeranylgeranylglyceryl phosphate synthase n=1 Tax=Candidatus Methanoplasma termitum TaxID=1577791 RepID=A0A0A7LHG8_9ARCH|nr:UbiA family prenyltransferase [Candidatus Methanoplasma termitum]AIZ56961.1 digeranylgeranylglyceryl phosphate synthase [Candidatus Methanoplasma termitum]MCL2333275.1 UbiA family prenyltransferase [Candidatus Methanoplasma sp.]
MNRFLRLFRLGNGIMGILGVIIGAFIAVGFDIGDHVLNLIIAGGVILAFIIGGNSINDYIDVEIDRTAHPERPLPRGEISPTTARNIGIAGLVVSCALSVAMLSIIVTAIVLIAAVLMISYELLLKQRGFIGNVVIAILTGMIFLFGGAVVNSLESNIIIAAMAALVSIGREIAKDIQDMESDEGRKTLPMAIGKKNAAMIGAVFFILGPVLSIWPIFDDMFGWLYYIVFIADALFIYSAFIIFRRADVSQKVAKYAMFIALIAFVLGVVW